MSATVEAEQCLDSMLDDTLTDVVYQNSSLFNDSLDEEYTVNKTRKRKCPSPIGNKPKWLRELKRSPMVVTVTTEQCQLLSPDLREEEESPPLFPLTQPDSPKGPKYVPTFGKKKKFVIPKVKNVSNSSPAIGGNKSTFEVLPHDKVHSKSEKVSDRSLSNSKELSYRHGSSCAEVKLPKVCKNDSSAKKKTSSKEKTRPERAEKSQRKSKKRTKELPEKQKSPLREVEEVNSVLEQANCQQMPAEKKQKKIRKRKRSLTETVQGENSASEEKRVPQVSPYAPTVSTPRLETPVQVTLGRRSEEPAVHPHRFTYSPTSSEEDEEGPVTPPNCPVREDPNRSVSRPKPGLLLHAIDTEPTPRLLPYNNAHADSSSSDKEYVSTPLRVDDSTASSSSDGKKTPPTPSPGDGHTPSPTTKVDLPSMGKKSKLHSDQPSHTKRRKKKTPPRTQAACQPPKTLWVQCDRADCLKWRKLRGCHDPAQFTGKWYCCMNPDPEHNSCQAPAESSDEIDEEEEEYIYSPFVLGSLVWAKLEGFPWWPAIVDMDPDTDVYYETNGGCTPVQFHVVFLDTPVCRAWIGHHNVHSFTNQSCHYYDISTEKIPIKYQKSLDIAVQEGMRALYMSLEERLEMYGFMVRFDKERAKKRKGVSRQKDTVDSSCDQVSTVLVESSQQSSAPGSPATCPTTMPTARAMKRSRS